MLTSSFRRYKGWEADVWHDDKTTDDSSNKATKMCKVINVGEESKGERDNRG